MLRFILVLLSMLALGAAAPGYPQTGAPIKIGVLLPYTGPWALYAADVTKGMELALEQVGARAGGRPLQLIKEDTELKPDVALTKARKVVERDGVDAVTGVMSSGELLAMREYIHKQGVPLLVTTAGAREVTAPPQNSPWIFRIAGTSDQPSYPFGQWVIKNTKYRNAVVIASDFVGGRQFAGAFMAGFRAGGGNIVRDLYVPLGAPDVSSYIIQIAALKPDVVYAWFGGADSIRFVKTYAEYGLKGKIPLIGHNALCEDNFLPEQGEAAMGIVSMEQYTPALDTPESRAFVKAYEAKHKVWPPRNAEGGYTSILLLAAAFDRMKGPASDRTRIQAAIKEAARGILPPRGKIDFDAHQQVVLNQYVMRVERRGPRMTNIVIDTIPNVSQESVWGWWNKQ